MLNGGYQLDALSSIFMLVVTGVGYASSFSPPATCMATRASTVLCLHGPVHVFDARAGDGF